MVLEMNAIRQNTSNKGTKPFGTILWLMNFIETLTFDWWLRDGSAEHKMLNILQRVW